MSRVSFVFATGESWLDYVVKKITRSRWSHVAIRFDADNILAEALVFRGLILEPGDKYVDWPMMQEIQKDVDLFSYQKMLEVARSWEKRKVSYGYLTCFAIGIRSLAGLAAGRIALKLFPDNAESTLICSEMIVKLWRIGSPGFFAEQNARLVSPEDLYRSLSS